MIKLTFNKKREREYIGCINSWQLEEYCLQLKKALYDIIGYRYKRANDLETEIFSIASESLDYKDRYYDFKVGEKIICVKKQMPNSHITVGLIYEIKGSQLCRGGERRITITGDKGKEYKTRNISQFKLWYEE
jgi:hypothetical protein